jgi:hypothetical protein
MKRSGKQSFGCEMEHPVVTVCFHIAKYLVLVLVLVQVFGAAQDAQRCPGQGFKVS